MKYQRHSINLLCLGLAICGLGWTITILVNRNTQSENLALKQTLTTVQEMCRSQP